MPDKFTLALEKPFRAIKKEDCKMKTLDRVLILALAIGIWALVLTPGQPDAHSGQDCYFQFSSGYGTVEDLDVENGELYSGDVYIEDISGYVYCD